jgi:hypothetical protein
MKSMSIGIGLLVVYAGVLLLWVLVPVAVFRISASLGSIAKRLATIEEQNARLLQR